MQSCPHPIPPRRTFPIPQLALLVRLQELRICVSVTSHRYASWSDLSDVSKEPLARILPCSSLVTCIERSPQDTRGCDLTFTHDSLMDPAARGVWMNPKRVSVWVTNMAVRAVAPL
jgi:hypothetical protein